MRISSNSDRGFGMVNLWQTDGIIPSLYGNYKQVKMKVLLNIKLHGYVQFCTVPISMKINIALVINFNDSLYNWNEWHSVCHQCIKFQFALSYYALFCIPWCMLVNDSVCLNKLYSVTPLLNRAATSWIYLLNKLLCYQLWF